MEIVFATNNLNKLSEIRSLVPNSIKILGLQDINCYEQLPETNPTLEQNALEKARFVFNNYGFNCFADDTGLEINVLGGEPGVYSARYAGEECIAENNIKKVLKKIKGEQDRRANFKTVIGLIINGQEILFEGKCSCNIINFKIGKQGFGYDPIFQPSGYNKTFAQMTKQEKGTISHRGKAVKKLISFLSRD